METINSAAALMKLLAQNAEAVISTLHYEESILELGNKKYDLADWRCMAKQGTFFLSRFKSEGGERYLADAISVVASNGQPEAEQIKAFKQGFLEAQQEMKRRPVETLNVLILKKNLLKMAPRVHTRSASGHGFGKKADSQGSDLGQYMLNFFVTTETRGQFVRKHQKQWVAYGSWKYQQEGRGLLMIMVKSNGSRNFKNFKWGNLYFPLNGMDLFEELFSPDLADRAMQKVQTYDPATTMILGIWVIEANQLIVVPVVPGVPFNPIASGMNNEKALEVEDRLRADFPEILDSIFPEEFMQKTAQLQDEGFSIYNTEI